MTFAAKWFYSNKYYNYKLNYYECGFRSLTNYKVHYKVSYVLLVLFLLIYDGEFLILIPFSLNFFLINVELFILLIFFLVWLLLTLIIDFTFNALDWQV